MKYGLFLLVMITGYCHGQNTLRIYPNGLIYADTTMHKSRLIVDSPNAKFRANNVSHPYYSLPQGRADYVEIPSKAVLQEIKKGMSYAGFAKAHPGSIVQKDAWLVKTHYTDQGKRLIQYYGLPAACCEEVSISLPSTAANDKNSGWVISADGKAAFYIKKLETQQLPPAYARLVQYVDYVIDTTTDIYLPGAKEIVDQKVKADSKAGKFIGLVRTFPNEPMPPKDSLSEAFANYPKNRRTWDSLRLLHVDQQMKTEVSWKASLSEARDEALATGNTDTELDFFIAQYLSKADALKLKRGRKVIGKSKRDLSPRYHAAEISQLAAETTQWDIFLRAHLDIMNDTGLERRSDGNLKKLAQRDTYVKELEEMNIAVVDLMIGTTLRVQKMSDNHYWGSNSRVGAALADSKEKYNVKNRLLRMIQDPALDPFNRLQAAYMFSNYAYSLEGSEQVTMAVQDLKRAIQGQPDFLMSAMMR
jgi:hypothetical protein